MLRWGSTAGWCPICEKSTIFYKEGEWLRDQYLCLFCKSIPRWRALIHTLECHFPQWRNLDTHESSPGGSSSSKISKECHKYLPTHFFTDIPLGHFKKDCRCENLEALTFPNESFDLFITQDVFEHILNPEKAFAEIARTLRKGGAHIFSLPWYHWKRTIVRAVKQGNIIKHLKKPNYHKNPIDQQGSLVVTEWGSDLVDFISDCSGLTTTIIDPSDKRMGIEGKFLEIFISRKLS